MKKIVFIVSLSIISWIGYGQNIGKECISCIKNEVNAYEGASALGTQNQAMGGNSFAVGFGNKAIGVSSIAMTHRAIANGESSIAMGYMAKTYSPASLAFGAYSTTGPEGMLSVAMGSYVKSEAYSSFVLGFGTVDDTLRNPIEKSLMIGFDSDIPTFFVEKANGVGTVGKVGIGTTSPTELLEVDGNMKVNQSAIISSASIDYLIVNGTAYFNNSQVSGLGNIIGYNNQMLIKNNGFGTAKIFLASDGNIGVGTESPQAKLDVNGSMVVSGNASFAQNLDVIGNATFTQNLEVTGNTKLNSNLSIGCNPHAGYVLSVKGKILSEDVTVVEEVGADFVFADDYKLPALEEVESYIAKNQHLAEIPSAKEMMEEGVDIGKFQIKLLQKLEELTLYTIEQQKAIKRQAEMIEELRAKIAQ